VSKKVIEGALLVLSVCDGAFSRDERGYDVFDAGLMRSFLCYPDIFGVEGLTPEEVEFIRRKLLRYRKQLREMRFDAEAIEKPIHSVCFFAHGKDWEGNWLRVSPHSIRKIGWLFKILRHQELGKGWLRMHVKFKRPSPLKEVWVRLNDVDEKGKTRKC